MTQPTSSPDELNDLDNYHNELCSHVNHKSAACDCGIQDLKEHIQSSYIPKQAVIDAIGEDEYVGNPHHERFVGASWSNELRKEIRQKLNLHDNQQRKDK